MFISLQKNNSLAQVSKFVYAYGMSSQAKKHIHRRRIVVMMMAAFFVIAVGVGGYIFFTFQQKVSQEVLTSQKAKDEVKALNLDGDKDLQARFIDLASAKKESEAKKLFNTAVDRETDTAKKLDLLRLHVSLALQYRFSDQALEAALKSVDIQPSSGSYDNVIRVYVAKNDLDNQKKYILKARELAVASSDPYKESRLAGYDTLLKNIEVRQKVKRS